MRVVIATAVSAAAVAALLVPALADASETEKCRVELGKVATGGTLLPPLSVHQSFDPDSVKRALGPDVRERRWSAASPDEPDVEVEWVELSTRDVTITLDCGFRSGGCLLHSARYAGAGKLPCGLKTGDPRSAFVRALGEPTTTAPDAAVFDWAEFFDGGATRGDIRVSFGEAGSSTQIAWSYWAD